MPSCVPETVFKAGDTVTPRTPDMKWSARVKAIQPDTGRLSLEDYSDDPGSSDGKLWWDPRYFILVQEPPTERTDVTNENQIQYEKEMRNYIHDYCQEQAQKHEVRMLEFLLGMDKEARPLKTYHSSQLADPEKEQRLKLANRDLVLMRREKDDLQAEVVRYQKENERLRERLEEMTRLVTDSK